MVDFNEFMKDGWSYPKKCGSGGDVDPELIDQSVNKYFEENPPTSTAVESAINSYMEKNTPDDLSEGLTGALEEFIENNATDMVDYLMMKDQEDNSEHKISIKNGNINIDDSPLQSGNESVSEEQISTIVEEKITQAANSITNPFETAYWKDSSDGNIYLVSVINGVLSITKQGLDPDQPEDLEDLLTDRLLIWHDEFDGDALDTSIWSYETGYKRNNEPQNYTEDAVTVSNSICKITAKKRSDELTQTVNGTDHVMTWDSGSIHTMYNAMFIEGRIEAKIRHNGKAGSWPAFWFVGYGAPWPYAGEYDVFEFWGSGSTKDHTTDTHYATRFSDHAHDGTFKYPLITDNDWHVWAVEFKRTSVEYYLDSVLIKTVDFSNTDFWLGYTSSTSNVAVLKFPKYAKLNLAVRPKDSGYYPRHSDDMTMEIDWIRYYASEGVTELTDVNDTVLSFNPWCESDGSVMLSKLKTISDVKRIPLLTKQRDSDGNMIYNGLIKAEPYTYSGDDVENIVNTNALGPSGISVKNTGTFTINTKVNGVDVTRTFTVK